MIKEITETKYESYGRTFVKRESAEEYARYRDMVARKSNYQLEQIMADIHGGGLISIQSCKWDTDSLQDAVVNSLKRISNVCKEHDLCI